ncbi:MAG: lactate utilization protein [Eubacterium sp.]|nr:lactate utilization protein [Eubacterium sp.]
MTPKQLNYRHLGESMIRKFEKRNMTAYYVDSKEDARKKVLELIPQGASVTYGGSETLEECGIKEALKKGDYAFIERTDAKTPEEKREMMARQMMADYFLMSTNAFTKDGELVNIDGNGNRVCFLIQGPAHVIIVTGMNKLAFDIPEAFQRIHNVATPPNCVRLGCKTPCSVTGTCGNCLSPDTICCQEIITRYSKHPGRITIIMVGEDLGF